MTMIERVARALYNDYDWAKEKGMISLMHNTAKTAIEAMREPTEKMIDAGAYDLDMTIKTQYQNMIDAALKE